MMSFRSQLFIAFVLSLTLYSRGISSYLSSENENATCEKFCEKNVATDSSRRNDWDSESLEDSCRRGCRFYAIVEVLNKTADHSTTQSVCYENCHDAYLGLDKDSEACRMGCAHQQPFKMKTNREDLKTSLPAGRENIYSILYPILQIHNLYKSVQTKSWSIFAVQDQTGNSGDLVIVQTDPLIKPSNLYNVKDLIFGQGTDPNSRELNDLNLSKSKTTSSFGSVTWLTNLPQSTGMPGTFLFILLLLPALALVWLCMSAAETAPDQYMKLSVKSDDLHYIHRSTEEKSILAMYPQAAIEARPLPSKMTVDKI